MATNCSREQKMNFTASKFGLARFATPPLGVSSRHSVRRSAGALCCVLLHGCRNHPLTPVCSIDITPTSISIRINDSTAVEAIPLACDGATAKDRIPNFASTDSTIVTVRRSGLLTGVLVGVRVGQASVIAVANGKVGTVPVNVHP